MRTPVLSHEPLITANSGGSPGLPVPRLLVGDLITTTPSTVRQQAASPAADAEPATPEPRGVLCVIVCGAGPASGVTTLIKLAHVQGWITQVVATPSALPFIDTVELKALTGLAVRSNYLSPGQQRAERADAVVVAPATYNTISKCALGISDTYALGVLAEAIGLGLPVVMLPFVNTALAGRRPFERSVVQLRHEGVRVLLGPDGVEPHSPGTGAEHIAAFPWQLALDAVRDAAHDS